MELRSPFMQAAARALMMDAEVPTTSLDPFAERKTLVDNFIETAACVVGRLACCRDCEFQNGGTPEPCPVVIELRRESAR